MSKYLKVIKKKCSYPECENKYGSNGLCKTHYLQCRYDKYAHVRQYLINKNIKKYTPAYASYMNMIQRCYNKNNILYHYYGGRGVRVCSRWLESYENFLEDMGERVPPLTLDRINVDGHYTPDNCRWASRLIQSQNRRPRKKSE